jgi:hypothetical protein
MVSPITKLGLLTVSLLFSVSTIAIHVRSDGTFSLPDSVLLFADEGHELQIVTAAGAQHMKLPIDLPVNSGVFTAPSLARDAKTVSWGFATTVDLAGPRRHVVLGMRSVTGKDWKTFGDFRGIGATAISPDGSKIALTVELDHSTAVMIFEVSTGEVSTLALTSPVVLNGGVGWSPDSKQLVVERFRRGQPSLISVADLTTGSVRDVVEGVSPSWSPTGEWIAYLDVQSKICTLVHPDGTGAKVVRDIHKKNRMIYYAPVWSPDGAQLLLNDWNEWKGYGFDFTLVNTATGRSTTIRKNGELPVFGWAKPRK